MSEKVMATDEDLVYWCDNCNVPIIKKQGEDLTCPCCDTTLKYLTTDIRPVFPEERLLIEILLNMPLEFLEKSVWASNNRYYVNGEVFSITAKHYKKYTPEEIIKKLEEFALLNKSVLNNLKNFLILY